MEHLEILKERLESFIYALSKNHQPELDLLPTVPGISAPLSAIRILAEIGADMSAFETAKKLCSWAGVTPQNNESAGKKKSTRIFRAYAELIPPEFLEQSKAETHLIESNNMPQRHWFARFRRKSCVVSRCERMVDLTIMLYAKFHVNGKFDYHALAI
jgi:hypothetical protein